MSSSLSTTPTTKIFVKPSSGPIGQVIMATVPLFIVLCILLIVAWRRSDAIPYDVPAGASEQQMIEGYQAELDALIPLEEMVWVFLSIGLLWSFIAVYLTFFRRKRNSLLRRYLRDGLTQLGDVMYKGRPCCRFQHRGEVIYPHPNYKMYPVYFRRTVPVYDQYTKEKTTLLVLPDQARSAHVKKYIEEEVEKMNRNARKMYYIRILAWVWAAFALIGPLYILSIIRRADEEISNYRQTRLAYLIIVLAVIPIVCVAGNWIAWYVFFRTMTRGDSKTASREDYAAWTDVKGVDFEMAEYQPPTPNVSERDYDRNNDSPVLVEYDHDDESEESYEDQSRKTGKIKIFGTNHF